MNADKPPLTADDEVERFEAGEPADVVPPMSVPMRRLAAVVWPAFLMAGVLEVLVFSLVDPGALHWPDGPVLEANRMLVYTLGFFVFWAAVALGSALTQMMLAEPDRTGTARS